MGRVVCKNGRNQPSSFNFSLDNAEHGTREQLYFKVHISIHRFDIYTLFHSWKDIRNYMRWWSFD